MSATIVTYPNILPCWLLLWLTGIIAMIFSSLAAYMASETIRELFLSEEASRSDLAQFLQTLYPKCVVSSTISYYLLFSERAVTIIYALWGSLDHSV